MEQNTQGLNRIIRILDEELVELQTAGLYKEAEETRKRIEAYVDMRSTAQRLIKELPDDNRR